MVQQTKIAQLESTLNVGFHKEEGPFVKGLEDALASFHVQRQAYYSGTFVGNHVHRTLKVHVHVHFKNSHTYKYISYLYSHQTLKLCAIQL